MSTRVRTVLGDIAPEELGATDYHEHLFQVSPLLRGDELDDEAASTQEAELLRRAGAGAMVEATPTGLGRRPEAVARVSAGTGLRIVHVTGAHREAHYAAGDPLLVAQDFGAGRVVVTEAADTARPLDAVQPDEADAAREAFRRRGLSPVWHETMRAAMEDVARHSRPGDLIVLIGAQGMDAGRDELARATGQMS